MQACPYCQNILSEKSIFCSKCGKQARCKNSECRDLLELDASFCGTCGVPVGEAGAGQSASSGNTQLPALGYNTIHLEEDRKTLSLHTVLSDDGLASLSNPLSMIIASRMGIIGNRVQRPPITKDVIIDDPRLLLNSGALGNGNSDTNVEEPKVADETETPTASANPNIPPLPQGSDEERLGQILRLRNEQLHLDEPDIKARSKKDYARRLTYLFLYAHEKRGNDSVPRSVLTAILDENSVNDGNTRYWISKNSSLVSEGDNIRLNNAGRREAQAALNDVFDTSKTAQGWLPGENTYTRGVKAAEGSTEKAAKPAGRRGRSPSKTATEWAARWKGLNMSVNGHAILKDKGVFDRAIFGLWAIRHTMGDAGKVVSRSNLSKFIYEAFEYKINERSVERALKGKEAAGKIINVEGTKFQIQPTGIEYAEQLAGLNNTATSAAASKGATKKK
ncbi:MAG TPA: zinc ribbon domain-containing protein [Pyrinomonadaceae bacterium]|jgi:hypothetical protein